MSPAAAAPMSRAAADLMSPAAAALIRPAGVVPVLASHPAAGPPDPAVALDLRGVAQEGAQAVLEVRVASAVGQVAAVSVEAGAANGDLRNCVAALGAAGATYPSFHLSDPDDVADPDVNFRQVANDFFNRTDAVDEVQRRGMGSVRRHHHR
jgi:hypothetical protein